MTGSIVAMMPEAPAEASSRREPAPKPQGRPWTAKLKQSGDDSPEAGPRFFDPWRRPAGLSMTVLVTKVVGAVEGHEAKGNLRRRRRRAGDQSIFEDTVAAIVCDLAHQHLTETTRGITVSRSRQMLTQRSVYRPAIYGEGFTRVLDHLTALGFLRQAIGYQGFAGSKGERTTIHAGSELLELLAGPGINASDIGPALDQPTIILKATKGDRWEADERVEYDPALPAVVAMQEQLDHINQHLAGADLNVLMPEGSRKIINLRDTVMRRVFTRGSFESGGRLFGGFWQGMRKADRLDQILIDGEPVVELDYAQMAPRILYGLAGVRPTWDDAYLLPGLPEPFMYREGVKKLVNAMLFAEGGLTRKPQGTRDLLPSMPIQQLQAMIADQYRPIAHHFGTGVGHELQLRESEILAEVMDRLISLGVVCLPIHDAVMVPSSMADAADQTMRDVFVEMTGGEIHVGRTSNATTHTAIWGSP